VYIQTIQTAGKTVLRLIKHILSEFPLDFEQARIVTMMCSFEPKSRYTLPALQQCAMQRTVKVLDKRHIKIQEISKIRCRVEEKRAGNRFELTTKNGAGQLWGPRHSKLSS
jgi:hypothetical protein